MQSRRGHIDYYPHFDSHHVVPRNVEVWVPEGYAGRTRERYPVLYMHDGQNVFNAETSLVSGVAWGVDEALAGLVAAGRARPALVVAIWHGPARMAELMPQKPVEQAAGEALERLEREVGRLQGDAYLRFVVHEVKSFVDATYRTLPGQPDTFIMGSSLGGLMSFYAVAEYPDVFGGAGCVSTHWPFWDGLLAKYAQAALPDPRAHKLYFDYGTQGIDEHYEPYQLQVDAALRAAGYVEGENWITRKFPGATHSEAAWRDRVWLPLEFLLGRPR